jgi:hypothetical protein
LRQKKLAGKKVSNPNRKWDSNENADAKNELLKKVPIRLKKSFRNFRNSSLDVYLILGM